MLVTLRCFIICLLFEFIQPQYEKATRFSDTGKCPYVSQWNERAEDFCRDKFGFDHDARTRYHCLEKQSGGYVELCINPMKVKEGHYPKWSSHNDPPRMYPVECPTGSYQPYERWSNEFNKCKMKSNCSEKIGQLYSWCPDGGTLDDLQCRCDFQKGYVSNLYAFHNPLNKSCFTPSRENSACSMYSCGDNKELDRAYRCVQKCPEHWHRPPRELECKQNKSQSYIQRTTTIPKSSGTKGKGWDDVSLYVSSTLTVLDATRWNQDEPRDGLSKAIIVFCVLFIIIVIAAAFYFFRKRWSTDALKVAYGKSSDTVDIQDPSTESNTMLPNEGDRRVTPSPPATIYVQAEVVHVHQNQIEYVENAIVGDEGTIILNTTVQNVNMGIIDVPMYLRVAATDALKVAYGKSSDTVDIQDPSTESNTMLPNEGDRRVTPSPPATIYVQAEVVHVHQNQIEYVENAIVGDEGTIILNTTVQNNEETEEN